MFWNKLLNWRVLWLDLKRMTALRQAVFLAFSFVILLFAGGAVSTWLIEREIEQNIDQQLLSMHSQLSQQLMQSENVNTILPKSPVLFASYRDKAGLIYGVKSKKLFNKQGFINIDIEMLDNYADDWRIYAAKASTGILTVAINLEDRYQILVITGQSYLAVSIVVSVMTLIVGLAMGLVNQRRYNKISQVLETIAAGDLSARIAPQKQQDDLDLVATRIDATTHRLEVLMRQMKDLSANIAHDLRTPMARLRAKIETALFDIEQQTSAKSVAQVQAQHADTLETALTKIDEMMNTFTAILRISNLSSGEFKGHFVTLSLANIVNETAEIYAAVIEDSGRLFSCNVMADSTIQGSRELIIQLLANLIENSIRHTPKGSHIYLNCDKNLLQLVDDGDGISEAYHQRVLEPMYRLETSRQSAGNGLGLALVNSICRLHDAHLSLSKSSNQDSIAVPIKDLCNGLTVTISFEVP